MTFRVRALDSNGDMTFGKSGLNFYADSPAAVSQCILTRLELWEGNWWLDLTKGTPWFQQILGNNDYALAEAVLYNRVLTTPFVLSISDFSATFISATRAFQVSGECLTAFGALRFNYPTSSVYSIFTANYSPVGGYNPLG